MSTTEDDLNSLGLSSASLDALSPAARSAIERLAELAARELCTDRYLEGGTGIVVNLLGDRTQLNAALAGPLRAPAESSGMLSRFRVLPLSRTICADTVAAADGYLDLSDPHESKASHEAILASLSGGAIQAYAGVAVDVGGVRVGTLCLYGSAANDPARRDAREAGLRRYGAILSRQLAEAAQLSAENAAIRAELRSGGAGAVGEDGIYRDREEAAAWRETTAMLGDVERAVSAAGASDGVAACVIEVSGQTGKVAIVATSEAAGSRFGVRPCRLRKVGDEDPARFWLAALAEGAEEAGEPRAYQEDALTDAVAAARLGTPPGTFASVTAAALPGALPGERALRGLVVLCARPPSSDAERGARRALVSRLGRAVAEAQRAALAVFTAPSPGESPVPGTDEPDAATLERIRQAFGSMKLRGLLALAEERGIPGTDDATSAEEILRLIAAHATRLGRERRAHLESLPIRELLAIGAASGIEGVERAESKRDMIFAILEAEGLFAERSTAPLPPLPVPPRAVLSPTPEQKVVAFDPGASWLREAQQRSHDSLPYSWPGAWTDPNLARPPVPRDEALRNAAIERLGLGDVRDLTPDELVTFDGIAAGAAAVAGAFFGAVTLVHAEEQVVVGITSRSMMQPILVGDVPAMPRTTTLCQYGAAKGAALAVVDTSAPEAGPVAKMVRWDSGCMPVGYDMPPRSYLGVPLVSTEGVVLGNVCIVDNKPRPDFAEDRRLVEQIEGLAAAVVNLFELRRLRRENSELHARRQLDVAAVQPLGRAPHGTAPTDRLALLMTDIEGSTELHERDRALMKRALEVHDAVLRRAIADNGGIEVATEGDAFLVAFHTAADAIRCAFDAQLRLAAAPWPAGLEKLGASTASDPARAFTGCRVRMTVHFTESGGGLLGRRRFEITRHAVTRRPQYRGPFVDEARYVSEMASGGQVLVTQQAFDEVALALTTALGDPRVVDLGRYEDPSLGDLGHVYELTPRALAARMFTPPIRVPGAARLTAPGYIHAPSTSPLVVLFVLPVGFTALALRSDAEHSRGLEAFTGAIRECLAAHGGYEMKENEGAFMCAFRIDEAARALAFGADVHARVAAVANGAFRCRVGINSGEVAVEPHVRTGRLEAYGPPCNRAARLSKAANVGQTLVDAGTADIASPGGASAALFDLGEHRFKGLDEAMRVLQVGGGFFPPIRSLSYAAALVDFVHSDAGNVTRSRTFLAAMDSTGSDVLPISPELSLDRAHVRDVLERGLAERDAAMTTARWPRSREQR